MQVAMLGALWLAVIEQSVDADPLTGVTEPLVAELEELVVAHSPGKLPTAITPPAALRASRWPP